jgi:hypothetical protein
MDGMVLSALSAARERRKKRLLKGCFSIEIRYGKGL